MLLFRAAELTNEKGFDWFVISEKDSDERISEQYGRTDLSSLAIVKMFKGVKPDGLSRSYDAKSVLEHLGKSIQR